MADFEFIQLDTKPTAKICFSFYPSASPNDAVLLVYLNGLVLPQVAWDSAIVKLKEMRGERSPPILTYDRYGQGQTTDRDPNDEGAPDPTHAHDCMSAVADLRQLLNQISKEKLGVSEIDNVKIVFVCNSIGCALARLYTQTYPGTVAGLMFLDSVLANTDMVSIIPDPDSPGFDLGKVPSGITPDVLRDVRASIARMFHPSVGSKEGMSRKNLAELMPASNAPVLEGRDGRGPFVTVVGHEFKTFAEDCELRNGWPKILVETYLNPYWHAYNVGLTKITEDGRAKGPLQAPGTTHFIQKDNPSFVAQELDELLSKIM